MYIHTNGYDCIVKIEDEKVRVLTESKDFPNMKNGYFSLTDGEKEKAINDFMDKVIESDNSHDWEAIDSDEILNNFDNEVLWEKVIE